MNTKVFDNDFIGFEVKDAKDVLAADSLGFSFCDEDGEYFDSEPVVDDDEVERDPTGEEVINRVVDHIKANKVAYATMYAGSCGYQLVESANTMAMSKLYIGQYVYVIHENKIKKAKICIIEFVRGLDSSGRVKDRVKCKINLFTGTYKQAYIVVRDNELFETLQDALDFLASNVCE